MSNRYETEREFYETVKSGFAMDGDNPMTLVVILMLFGGALLGGYLLSLVP